MGWTQGIKFSGEISINKNQFISQKRKPGIYKQKAHKRVPHKAWGSKKLDQQVPKNKLLSPVKLSTNYTRYEKFWSRTER